MMRTLASKSKRASGRRNAVRIIGGAWRGRRVQFPDSPGLRPTPDRVRETLFNWLQQSIAGTRCLDLFAGSGALGIEALSRGAREVVFVEQARDPARALSAELERLGGSSRAHVIETAAQRFLAAPGEPFDGVFLDPPYGRGYLPECVAAIEAGGWVNAGGWVYLESECAAGVPAVPPHWDLVQSKSAGEVGYHLARISAARIRARVGQ
jgi:16S rRNA (guanine966-N2)-methyltransferase